MQFYVHKRSLSGPMTCMYDIFAATAPYFKNLPATLTFQQSDVLVSGVEITTLIPYDANPDDVGGLKVKMAEDWIDIFTFDSNTCKYMV